MDYQKTTIYKHTKTNTMSESKLWQLRAGLITESEYQASMEEEQDIPGVKKNNDVETILNAVKLKTASLKGIKDTASLIMLLRGIVDTIQGLNDNALTNSEVLAGLRKLIAPPEAPKSSMPSNKPPIPPASMRTTSTPPKPLSPAQARASFGIK